MLELNAVLGRECYVGFKYNLPTLNRQKFLSEGLKAFLLD